MATTESAEAADSPEETPLGPQFTPAGSSRRTASASIRADSDRDETPAGWLWKRVATAGVLALAAAVAVVVLPGTVLPPLELANETVRSLRSFAVLLGAFVGIFGLYVAYHRGDGDDVDDSPVESVELPAENPERTHGPTNAAVGSELDDRLERVGGLVEDAPDEAYSAYQIERSLRGLAVRVVSTTADCSTERAREHVDQGTWTDDVRAAAFVGGEDGPERTVRMRIGDWASGRPFDRQVEATVDELAARMGVDDP